MRHFPAISRPSTLLRFALAATGVLALAGAAHAATPLPKGPTTKIMAIGHLTPGATPEAVAALLPEEVKQTVQLHLDGKIDQWYGRKDQSGVVFFLPTADVGEARATLERLPLGQAKLMEFDYIPLGPLAPLGLLLRPAAK